MTCTPPQSGESWERIAEGDVMAQKQTTQVTFRQTVALSTGAIITAESPFKGMITELTFHFPDGCNALVEIAFKAVGGRFPTTGYIALNNATPVYKVSIPVFRWEILEVEVLNRDDTHPHTPSVIVTIEARE